MLTRNEKQDGGYSLAELLVVIVLAGLLLAMVVPNLLGLFRSYGTHVSARQIVSDLQSARVRSLSENVRYRFVFMPGSSGYVLQRRDPVSLAYVFVDGFTLPETTRFTSVVANVEFVPNGTVRFPGATTVTNNSGSQQSVVVSATGSIKAL